MCLVFHCDTKNKCVFETCSPQPCLKNKLLCHTHCTWNFVPLKLKAWCHILTRCSLKMLQNNELRSDGLWLCYETHFKKTKHPKPPQTRNCRLVLISSEYKSTPAFKNALKFHFRNMASKRLLQILKPFV